jgi:hypothetical protein
MGYVERTDQEISDAWILFIEQNIAEGADPDEAFLKDSTGIYSRVGVMEALRRGEGPLYAFFMRNTRAAGRTFNMDPVAWIFEEKPVI